MNKEVEKRIHEFAKQMYQAGYEDGYDKGYEDGKTAIVSKAKAEVSQYREGYDKGLKHGQELRAKEAECAEACGMKRAWELAHKLIFNQGNILDSFNYDTDKLGKIEVLEKIFDTYSASEAVEKTEAWGKKEHSNIDPAPPLVNCKDCVNYQSTCNGVFSDMESHCTAFEEKLDATKNDVKVGDNVRTTKDTDCANMKLFPIGTLGVVTDITIGANLPYKISANGKSWRYSRDMFEVVKNDITDINVENIGLGDEIYDIGGNKAMILNNFFDQCVEFLYADGTTGIDKIENCKKTGRHFNIKGILDAMKSEKPEEGGGNVHE